MDTPAAEADRYPEPGKLELIWGEGFMSPGGPTEIARILAGADLTGMTVLDLGSGLGGADMALVRNHGARHVTGADVQPELVEQAAASARARGLSDQISYRLIQPGLLPFPDAGFDAVFSKDAIIHVGDKAALYAEIFRILRPSGRLFVSDWLKGTGADADALAAEFVEAAGHPFHMVTLSDIAGIVRGAGFTEVRTEDRGTWYLGEAQAELARLQGDMGRDFARRFGERAHADETDFWRVLLRVVGQGGMSPGHIRARKP
ncbi:MAG: methyltransferase domain-containing protein [Paracoccaceae bacterium]